MAYQFKLVFSLALIALGAAGCSTAHTGAHHGAGSSLVEPGQGAFGALVEVVGKLQADPATRWEKVDIDGLRHHLVQMNLLVMSTSSTTSRNGLQVTFRVTGNGPDAIQAIHTMAPAHAAQLRQSKNWRVDVTPGDSGAVMTLTAADDRQAVMFTALGFYGVMSTGAHHQAHHYQMATGQGHGHQH